jgi:hypothetical protein
MSKFDQSIQTVKVDIGHELSSRLNLRISSGVIVVGRAVDLIGPETGVQAGDVIHQRNLTVMDNLEKLRAAV